jgi:hypothetical protein
MTSSKLGPSVFLLSLAWCSSASAYEPPPVPASATTLDDQQIRSTMMNKKLYGTTRKGDYPYSITFSADGTDVFLMSGSPPEKERWTLTNGVVCVIPKDYPKECSQVKTANNEYWFVDPATKKVNAHLRLKQ